MEPMPQSPTLTEQSSLLHTTWQHELSPQKFHQASWLPMADAIWKKQHPNKLYGGSWKCPLPSTYAEQEFSRMTCFANGSYGLDAIHQMNGSPLPERTRRVSTTNNSDATEQMTTINNFEERPIDVSTVPQMTD